MADTDAVNSRFFGSATLAQTDNEGQLKGVQIQDPFWSFADLGDSGFANRWDRVYPFQLLILRRSNGAYHGSDVVARFTLPIPPTDLTISTPFAINTSVTMGGILEEHNGAPIRMISLSGTTGVLPLRGTVASAADLTQSPSIFAGVITGAQSLGTAVSQTGNLLGLESGGQTGNRISDSELDSGLNKSTGYYQMLLLKRFLEYYASRKKTAADRDLRLAFAIWKEQEVYLVSPVSFDVRRSAASPLEYNYGLQLKAWRRILLSEDSTSSFEYSPVAKNPNRLAQVCNALETGQRLLEGARKTLEGLRADIQNILFTPLRQSLLFVKDGIGVVLTATDLPSNIISDLKEPILELASTRDGVQQLSRLNDRSQKSLDAAVASVEEAFRQLSINSGKADSESGRNPSVLKQALGARAEPANKVSDNPVDNYAFFSTIRPGDLNLRPDTVRRIEDERRRIQNLRREDFEATRDATLQVLADFSDAVGAGAATYTRTYGRPTPVSTQTPTDDDWEIIHTLSNVAQSLDALAASSTINRNEIRALDYIAGLASRSGIAFTVPRSKFAVPFPYQHTLEQVADRYLGDPNRWHEIAALNGLRAPYVDEVGFSLPLLTNGNGNQVLVSDGSRFYVSQQVWVSSRNIRREARRVQKITVLGPGQVALGLDGDADLSRYTVTSGAIVQAFLPDTVNSQQQIFIPSDSEPLEDDFRVKSIPGLDSFDPLLQSGGIDLLLTPGGDLVITPDGDCRLAVGLNNSIQRVRLALGTPRGSLLHHPEYGIGLRAGISTAELQAQDVLDGIKNLFRNDPGFTGVQAAAVNKYGNSLRIRLSIGLRGVPQFIPVQVEVKAPR